MAPPSQLYRVALRPFVSFTERSMIVPDLMAEPDEGLFSVMVGGVSSVVNT